MNLPFYKSVAAKVAVIAMVTALLGAVIAHLAGGGMYLGRAAQIERAPASAMASKAEQLQAFIERVGADAWLVAEAAKTVHALEGFKAAMSVSNAADVKARYVDDNPYLPADRSKLADAGDGGTYSLAHAAFHPRLKRLVNNHGYANLLLIDPKGNILYTTAKEDDFAGNLNSEELKSSPLAGLYKAMLAQGAESGPLYSEMATYAPSEGKVSAFAGAAIHDASGQLAGMAVLQFPMERLTMLLASQKGEGGRYFLLGRDYTVAAGLGGGERQEVPATLAGQYATAMEAGRLTELQGLTDPRTGERKHVALQPLHVGSLSIVLGHERPFSPAISLLDGSWRTNATMLAALGLLAAVIGFAWALASIARPLKEVALYVQKVEKGEAVQDVPASERHDEIGLVAQALESFRHISIQAGRILERQQVEAERMQQRRSITAMAHMHRKTSEAIDIASGALDAISAYMQQPAQQAAAHEAHEHETPSRPTVGHGAVSDMVQRVQDIANQINLLAVNVTVESARAGAGNKSLANVAAEVRGFAQQTASSAREIATQINQLHDTVAATDAPVVSKKATMVDWYTSAADISVPDIRDWAEQVASLSEEEERLQKKQA